MKNLFYISMTTLTLISSTLFASGQSNSFDEHYNLSCELMNVLPQKAQITAFEKSSFTQINDDEPALVGNGTFHASLKISTVIIIENTFFQYTYNVSAQQDGTTFVSLNRTNLDDKSTQNLGPSFSSVLSEKQLLFSHNDIFFGEKNAEFTPSHPIGLRLECQIRKVK